MIQEFPSIGMFFYWFFVLRPSNLSMAALLLALMFQVHYFHRTFAWPFWMNFGNSQTPLIVCLMAVLWTAVNGTLQARWLFRVREYSEDFVLSPLFLLGVTLFIIGMAINIHSDRILLNLRRTRKGSQYCIPRGGMFEYVSAANYFGESLEWFGYAMATGFSLAGLSFFIGTVANLAPRAGSHHAFYLKEFGKEYPKNRRRFIPFIW